MCTVMLKAAILSHSGDELLTGRIMLAMLHLILLALIIATIWIYTWLVYKVIRFFQDRSLHRVPVGRTATRNNPPRLAEQFPNHQTFTAANIEDIPPGWDNPSSWGSGSQEIRT